ncbi:MAG: SDR family oxidoreductase [Variovorax sp.]|nr:MAG: SDR family oxidoreductase [Variovorax sp.]
MNQKVLVTAGASGIGREIVRAFAAAGAAVSTCDIDAGALAELSGELPELHVQRCDISCRDDVESMVPAAVAALGGLDVLVNNAGVAGPTAPVDQLDADAWEQVINVNLNGTFNVTRLSIPYLKASTSGVIINMSSVAGRYGYANRSAYSTSKWGLIGFTKTLSIELGDWSIRVNAILPGAVEGPRIQRVLEGRAQLAGQSIEEAKLQALSHQSIKSFVRAEDIAAFAIFLASDAARSISGQALSMDGDLHQAS